MQSSVFMQENDQCVHNKCHLSECSQKAISAVLAEHVGHFFGCGCVSNMFHETPAKGVSHSLYRRWFGQLCFQQDLQKCHSRSPVSSQAKVMDQVPMPHEPYLFIHRRESPIPSHDIKRVRIMPHGRADRSCTHTCICTCIYTCMAKRRLPGVNM